MIKKIRRMLALYSYNRYRFWVSKAIKSGQLKSNHSATMKFARRAGTWLYIRFKIEPMTFSTYLDIELHNRTLTGSI